MQPSEDKGPVSSIDLLPCISTATQKTHNWRFDIRLILGLGSCCRRFESNIMQQPSPSEETAALLARLSSRPGVQSTLILSRDTGAIVRSTGLITAEDISEEGESVPNGIGGTDTEGKKKGTRNADAVARLVWNFVKSAGEMTEELNGESDEVKLLRLRTRKNELVVVPDAKFLLVVVHDTPPA